MRLPPLRAIACSLTLLAAIACNKEPGVRDEAGAVRTFPGKGIVRVVEPAGTSVTIQHEEIKGFMMAMTMPFNVRDTNELAGVQPGDTVDFRLNVARLESWIDQVAKSVAPGASSETNAPQERPPVRVARSVPELNVGDAMPDYAFTNELGQAIRLDQFRGRALVFTFIFTRCPIPDFCPRMSKNFADTYKRLTTTTGAPTNWHFLSISFDPHFDTPAVLKQYAATYAYDPRKWNFVTGSMLDIDAITDQFSLEIAVDKGDWSHRLRTVVVDAEGKIKKIMVGNTWTAEELASEIIDAAKRN